MILIITIVTFVLGIGAGVIGSILAIGEMAALTKELEERGWM